MTDMTPILLFILVNFTIAKTTFYSGHHCHECKEGFYGDPRNGGLCYHECNGRLRLTNISFGALGSGRSGSGANSLVDAVGTFVDGGFDEPTYCLWILTVYDSIVEAPVEVRDELFSLSIITRASLLIN